VAHLAELDTRASLYAAQGYGSLFTYCTEVLRLSEDAACNRIYAARACRRFPVILDALASGALSLTSVRMLSPHLTRENHEAVLAKARGRRRREIEALVAELAPRPDVASSVRRLPAAMPRAETPVSATAPLAIDVKPTTVTAAGSALPTSAPAALPATAPPAARRPIVETTSPERYRVQFTIGKESHDKLRRVQALLRREIPDTDNPVSGGRITSRHTPSHVKRSAWRNDGGQCAFVSKDGRQCTERAFLELHHIRPYALGGPPSTENISLRCRRHNHYEAELVFGPRTKAIEGDA